MRRGRKIGDKEIYREDGRERDNREDGEREKIGKMGRGIDREDEREEDR